ncbi:MAG: AzlD domain-containing protein, partial [Cognaticolwellia sp.]
MTLLTILLMACITFSSRYLFIHPRLPVRLGAKMAKFLSFSAPAVLTAIWVPIIFVQNGQLNSSINNPYLIAATFAVLAAAK